MKIKARITLETGKSAPDPRGSAPAGGESDGPEFSADLIARAAEDAVRELDRRCRPYPGEDVAARHEVLQGLFLAATRLVGEDSARHFTVFQAGRFLDDFEAESKGVM